MVTKAKVKPEPPEFDTAIPDAVGPPVTLGGGQVFRLKVLPFGVAVELAEIFTDALPEQGLFQGTTTGDTVIRALIVSRKFGAMDGILQQFVRDCPDGITARSTREELIAAVNAIVGFHGYDLAAAIIKNSAALAEQAFLRGMAKTMAAALPQVEAELDAKLRTLPALNGSAATTPPATPPHDGSATHPDSMNPS